MVRVCCPGATDSIFRKSKATPDQRPHGPPDPRPVLLQIITQVGFLFPRRNPFDCASPHAVRSGRWAPGSYHVGSSHRVVWRHEHGRIHCPCDRWISVAPLNSATEGAESAARLGAAADFARHRCKSEWPIADRRPNNRSVLVHERFDQSRKSAGSLEGRRTRAGANGITNAERTGRPRSGRPRTAVGSRRGAFGRIPGDLRSRKSPAPRTAREQPVGGSDPCDRTVDGAGELTPRRHAAS
jgi:hypothetical protein